MKLLIFLLTLSLLSACDGDNVPAEPSPPAPPKVRVSNSEQAPLSTPVEREDSVPPKIEIELEPVTAGNPDELPSDRVASAPSAKPAAPAAPKKKVAVEDVELPEPNLDLSLPEDWSEQLEPGRNATTMNLLPPLFESDDSRSLQMSGRLLPGLEHDEALIDGAQINFELKR
ncbi:hypothetical protein D7241_03575 [Stutzerimonas sp. VN223-3]|uniref:hypothetical protein n=1 Tax=Stutzerimonas sp. VN223-3 TaxID=3384601 RepID=UPI0038B59BB3